MLPNEKNMKKVVLFKPIEISNSVTHVPIIAPVFTNRPFRGFNENVRDSKIESGVYVALGSILPIVLIMIIIYFTQGENIPLSYPLRK